MRYAATPAAPKEPSKPTGPLTVPVLKNSEPLPRKE